MTKKSDASVFLFDLKLFSRSKASLLRNLWLQLKATKKPIILFTPNPEQLVLANQNPKFKAILHQADILVPDGIGLVWASKLLSWFGQAQSLSTRITGVEVVQALLPKIQKQGWSSLVIGGRDYGNGGQVVELTKSFQVGELQPGLFWHPGYQDISQPTRQEEQQLQTVLQKLQPELVFVAFGAPFQEQWVIAHQDLLAQNKVRLVMVVGGAFDFILGKVKRAPTWVQRIGGEWLYRLLQQPWRWRRQLRLGQFIKMVWNQLWSSCC
ncbi:MAG: WecB/TagA/CpsF family glycosyltransferase [Candidatus Pacebacteria bacterium]|nr:WecB/TagA/CpsF family glycosyltransferase [Candidatus Paceibacterota bacterium]